MKARRSHGTLVERISLAGDPAELPGDRHKGLRRGSLSGFIERLLLLAGSQRRGRDDRHCDVNLLHNFQSFRLELEIQRLGGFAVLHILVDVVQLVRLHVEAQCLAEIALQHHLCHLHRRRLVLPCFVVKTKHVYCVLIVNCQCVINLLPIMPVMRSSQKLKLASVSGRQYTVYPLQYKMQS